MMSLNYRGIMKSKLLAIALAAVTTVSVAEAKETKSTKAATVKSSSQSGKMYLRADAGYGFSKFRTDFPLYETSRLKDNSIFYIC